jgi:hypothetical protein
MSLTATPDLTGCAVANEIFYSLATVPGSLPQQIGTRTGPLD